MVGRARENLSKVQSILVDAGYTGENFATQIKTIIGATVKVIKRNELHSLDPLRSTAKYFEYGVVQK